MKAEDLASYQKIRAENGMPEISDKDALIEAQALINLITIASKGGPI